MKAINYAHRIKERQATSIHECELLTKAMHREGLLDSKLSIMVMPVYGKLRFVNSDFELVGVTYSYETTIDDIILMIKGG